MRQIHALVQHGAGPEQTDHATVRAQAVPCVPILIGGGVADEQVRQFVGADYWCGDALVGVRLCQRLMAARRSGEDQS